MKMLYENIYYRKEQIKEKYAERNVGPEIYVPNISKVIQNLWTL
jgi:hypothetical protein